MSIKQSVLFGVVSVVAVAIIVAFFTSIPVAKDTKPVVTLEQLEQLDNKLKSIKSDNESGYLKLETKQKELSQLEKERASLEEKLK